MLLLLWKFGLVCFVQFGILGFVGLVWQIWLVFSLIEVLFIFKAVFIFEFVFIFQVIFIFKIVFLFKVVFQFEVFIIFNVIFIFEVISIYVWISPATTKICTSFENCYLVFAFIFYPTKKNFWNFLCILFGCVGNQIFESKKQFENWPLAANLGLGWALQYP